MSLRSIASTRYAALFGAWFALLLAVAAGPVRAENSPDGIWAERSLQARTPLPERLQTLQRYRQLGFAAQALEPVLQAMRDEARLPTRQRLPVELSLPLPEGGFERFSIEPSMILPPELAAKYPEIVSFKGTGLDTPGAWARLNWGPTGFHGYAHIDGKVLYVDPLDTPDGDYISFYRKDLKRPAPSFFLERETDVAPRDVQKQAGAERSSSAARFTTQAYASGSQLRTYKLAVAATGEYTAYHGGSVANGLAAVTTAINRVDGIYEREFSVSLELVENNDQIIYTNAGTDPYSNDDPYALLDENQSNLDNVIGSANYDVGHVFSTGGGGLAGLGVVCNNSRKAEGETGSPAPTGDPYWVDYVAHELGHQFGANHTFNGNAGSCAGGNRNGSTAYEPGSGTTIMAYAGICGSQNIQANSDDHMHAASFDEVMAYLATTSCGSVTPTGNSAPVVEAGTGGFTIPHSTPFELVGSASDGDGQTLSYGWEQWDLGAAGAPNSPTGDAPIFRSFSPVADSARTFPRWSDILNSTQTIGELLPSYGRNLNFRLTARDNAGGVASDTIGFTVSGSAGPFRVTYPSVSGISLGTGEAVTVTWDVAGTNAAPVNCASVDILLSTDNGGSFATTLAAGTPNDGTQSVTMPAIAGTQNRVMVACSSSVFFDVSDYAFALVDGGGGGGGGNSLLVARAGTGTGTVTSSPAGIDCGSTCSAVFDTEVTLTATPADGSLFSGWSGDCSGSGTCSLPMDTGASVTATFTGTELIQDGGFEGGSPSAAWAEAGIQNGTPLYENGTVARAGSWLAWFGEWGSLDDSSVSQSVTIPTSAGATLSFYLQIYAGGGAGYLEVYLGGNRLFQVTEADAAAYSGYTLVQLNLDAYADGQARTLEFRGYSATNAGFRVDDVNLTYSGQVGASYGLSVSRTGNGTGRIISAPSGIDCGLDCSEDYSEGTAVTLTASADNGSTFVGWSGGGCSGGGSCSLTMDAAKSVSAEFAVAGSGSGCTEGNRTVTGHYSAAGTEISAEGTLDTSGTTTVASGAGLTLRAPGILLRPGFTAAAGSQFTARAVTVVCSIQ